MIITLCLRCFGAVDLEQMDEHVEECHKATTPCPTFGCPGDGRYAAPGRSHITGCLFPLAARR